MSEDPTRRDLEIRAAIDEYHAAGEEVERLTKENERWQLQNPPPQRPTSVRSTSEVEEFQRKDKEWSKPYSERLNKSNAASNRLRDAQMSLESVLPRDFAYDYKGRRYDFNNGNLRIADAT